MEHHFPVVPILMTRVIFNEECLRHKKWFTEGSSRKLPKTNKNLIIETRNEKNIQLFQLTLSDQSIKL